MKTSQITIKDIYSIGQVLTIEKARQLIGKRIYWTAPVCGANQTFIGEATILGLKENNRKPLIVENHNEGCWLQYGFLPYYEWSQESIKEMQEKHPNIAEDFTAINYGDSDRQIYFIEL